MKRFGKMFTASVLSLVMITTSFGSLAYGQEVSDDVNVKYVQEYYGEFSANISTSEFGAMLQTATGTEISAEGDTDINYANASMLATQAAGMSELAETYSNEKASKTLTANSIPLSTDLILNKYLATAIDTGIADPEKIKANKVLTKADASDLVVNAATANGTGRHYLGYSSDSDIYGKIDYAYDNFETIPANNKLMEIGNKAVKDKVVTGYNLRLDGFNSNFSSDLTLHYGHSDINHAKQLVGLLKSEGIVAKVNLEPKISAYEYLLEWGPVHEATPTYSVLEEGENFYIAYALEYDLVLEFANKSDLAKFDKAVNTYAKKNTGEEGKALLVESWWQPYYWATVNPGEGYSKVSDNIVTLSDNAGYSLHTTSLTEDTKTVQDYLKTQAAQDKTVIVSATDQYVDNAFLRYLKGETE